MSRYPPPRERSPTRGHFDRRPSATSYTPVASTYRGTGDPQVSAADRAPPRGPKADFRGGYTFGTGPRGRGAFPSRAGDTWDRDRDRERERERDRDIRNPAPPYRRDEERGEWPRRERDFPPSDRSTTFARERPYVGRDRSASPERPRRNSKESLPPFNRPSESASSYYNPSTRGGSVRGRGRGDWDRGRGRSSFVSERDREFFPRSRSREDRRDREYDRGRPSGPESERGDRFERREYDRPDDRDARARDHDVWPRDRSPGRNSNGRPNSPGGLSNVSQHGDRYKSDYDAARKPSLAGPLTSRSEGHRESTDYFSSTPRREGPLSQQFPSSSVPQSASIGLDYGPPPSVPATTPTAQEKPPSKPQPVKTEAPVQSTATAIIQPPSGPKADRAAAPPNAPTTPRSVTQTYEARPKMESISRQLRPGLASGSTPTATENSWKAGDPTSENRALSGGTSDRPLPANVPSGPRNPTGNFRARLLSNEQTSPSAPPTAPRQPKASTLENRPMPNAPTGPRSSTFPTPTGLHNAPPTGPQAGSNRQWVAPDYRPKPSIMNQLNKPFQPDGRERQSLSGPSMRPGSVTYQNSLSKPKMVQSLAPESPSGLSSAKASGLLTDVASGTQTPMEDDVVESPANVEMSLPASDEEDVEDDDGLDEDYFATSEETHQREVKLLESRKPLPPLLDPSTAALIVRIQLLSLIANDLVPQAFSEVKIEADSAMELDVAPANAPLSPEHTPDESSVPLEHPKPRGRPLSQPLIKSIPTPPLDCLPFLSEAIQQFHVFDEVDSPMEANSPAMAIRQQMEDAEAEFKDDMDELHEIYNSKYPYWKREVEQAEIRLREIHQPSPAPASPAPSATPSLPPGPERTRGARNTTDLDMQQAILMSQQSAKEEEERREREAASNARPNYETEAEVPFMLTPSEMDIYRFEDTSKMIGQEMALEFFGFLPPVDDFTDEEQAAFIAAYCQSPKKWGKIAESIPGRSYQDCIKHYYLTKDIANYKEHWRRSQPKRGRRRAANVKPRSNNLMSDLALNEDGESTPVAVTDSGRPRRAAAPTFGEGTDQDNTANAPQAKRLKEGVKETDPSQPKPRGRKGVGTGKGRKPKDKTHIDAGGQVLLPAVNIEASPKQERPLAGKEKIGRSGLKTENNGLKAEPFSSSTISMQMALDGSKGNSSDIPLGSQSVTVTPAVTSYWSVPEQQKFPELVQYWGRDYAAIANFLKTKSSIMIKNHYIKEINHGKVELERYAAIAEEKRARKEPMGPAPTPIQPPKRRYEAVPSIPNPRPISNSGDQLMSDVENVAPSSKPIINEFPHDSVHRIASGELVSKVRPPRETMHQSPVGLKAHSTVEDTVRNDRPAIVQKPMSGQGPPRGLFHEEPIGFAPQHQKFPITAQESSPRSRPAQSLDVQSREPRPQHNSPRVEVRGEFSRGQLQPGRESVAPPQAAALSYQSMSERPVQSAIRSGHNRNGSSHGGQSTYEQAAAGLASLGSDRSRPMAFGASAAHSPIAKPTHPAMPPVSNLSTLTRPLSQAEPPKPAPLKRSNLFSLINDDNEPPAKKSSLDGTKVGSRDTPPLQPTSVQTPGVPPRHPGDNLRSVQPPYMSTGRAVESRLEYRSEQNPSPAPTAHQSEWLDKLDPRKNQSGDSHTTHRSPAPGPYSVVPPSSQPSSNPTVQTRFDPARNTESRPRSLLGMSHVPSPPPQSQPGQPNRSTSNSSQHGRGISMTYSQNSTSGPPSYPHSTSSTPGPIAAHHRNQQSVDNRPLTIQQFQRAQQAQQQQQHHHQSRHRDIDIMQQPHQLSQQQQQQPPPQQQQQIQQEPPPQQHPRMQDRRDMYGTGHESRPSQQHQIPPPHSQTPQPQHSVQYSTAPPVRTFTPPHPAYASAPDTAGHGHGHHPHQQYQSHHQQQQQHQHPQQPQQQHQQQHHHQHHPSHQSHQSQYAHAPPPASATHHQPYQTHPSYGQPPPQSLAHQLTGRPPPSQQNHPRGYSFDERR